MPAGKERLEDELDALRQEYAQTRHNKATDKHLGILRRRIADKRAEITRAAARRHGSGFAVKRHGDATVALLGLPNAGKSTLINALTNTSSKVGGYAFTTLETVPGMMLHNGARIQLLDLPGIIAMAHLGAGGGARVLSAARGADALLIVVDINEVSLIGLLLRELRLANIYVNRRPPDVSIERRHTGGISIAANTSGLSNSEIAAVLKALRLHNAEVKVRGDLSTDELAAIASAKALYLPAVAALNKSDTVGDADSAAREAHAAYHIPAIPISAAYRTNLERLKQHIYDSLEIITVHAAPKGAEPSPVVMRSGSTLADLASRLRLEMRAGAYALVRGPSAGFPNQRLGASHILQHGDSVTFCGVYARRRGRTSQ